MAPEESSPKTRGYAFYRKKASSLKQADLEVMFRKASKSVSISIIVVSPDPLSLTTRTSTVKTEENPYDCEPADRVIKMEYFSVVVLRPKYKSSDEELPVSALVSIGTM